MIAIIPERVIGTPRNADRHRPESPYSDLLSLCSSYSPFAAIHHNSHDTGMTLQIVVSGASRVTLCAFRRPIA